MSLLPNKQSDKVKKTADMKQYYREYRTNNLEHARNVDRARYYRRTYNLSEDFVSQFGEYSGDVYKIMKAFEEVVSKCPELAEHIIKNLSPKENVYL